MGIYYKWIHVKPTIQNIEEINKIFNQQETKPTK